MHLIYIISLITALCWPLVGVSQTPDWTEDSWQSLTDEPSRRELQRFNSEFELEIESVPRGFEFPEDAGSRRTFGIDISHYTPSNLPFTKLAEKKILFVYMKATQGVTFKDPKFAHFWNSIGALTGRQKVARGAYHFLSASSSSDPELQAERFVAYVKLHGGFRSDDLPPVVDLEWDKASARGRDRWRHHTPAQIVARTLKFLRRVEKLTGKIPMIYTSRAWWRERGIPESEIAKFSRYKLWIADYSRATRNSENPRGPGNVVPDVWQFTDQARISGGPNATFDANIVID